MFVIQMARREKDLITLDGHILRERSNRNNASTTEDGEPGDIAQRRFP